MLAGTGKHKAAPRLTKPSSRFFVVAPLGTLLTYVLQPCPISYTWLLQWKICPTPWETAERSQCKGLVGVSLWHLSTVSEKATTVCICWWLISLLAMNLWNVSLEKTPCSFFSVNAFIHSGAEGAKFSSTLGSLGTFTKKLFWKVWFTSPWFHSVSELVTDGLDSSCLCLDVQQRRPDSEVWINPFNHRRGASRHITPPIWRGMI